MERYVVVCTCKGVAPGNSGTVATILDARAEHQGLTVLPSTDAGYTIDYELKRNRRGSGDSAPIKLECRSCGRSINVTFLTVRDVIDQIADKGSLPVSQLDAPPWFDDYLEAIGGKNHRVVPFSAMCYAITKLAR